MQNKITGEGHEEGEISSEGSAGEVFENILDEV